MSLSNRKLFHLTLATIAGLANLTNLYAKLDYDTEIGEEVLALTRADSTPLFGPSLQGHLKGKTLENKSGWAIHDLASLLHSYGPEGSLAAIHMYSLPAETVAKVFGVRYDTGASFDETKLKIVRNAFQEALSAVQEAVSSGHINWTWTNTTTHKLSIVFTWVQDLYESDGKPKGDLDKVQKDLVGAYEAFANELEKAIQAIAAAKTAALVVTEERPFTPLKKNSPTSTKEGSSTADHEARDFVSPLGSSRASGLGEASVRAESTQRANEAIVDALESESSASSSAKSSPKHQHGSTDSVDAASTGTNSGEDQVIVLGETIKATSDAATETESGAATEAEKFALRIPGEECDRTYDSAAKTAEDMVKILDEKVKELASQEKEVERLKVVLASKESDSTALQAILTALAKDASGGATGLRSLVQEALRSAGFREATIAKGSAYLVPPVSPARQRVSES